MILGLTKQGLPPALDPWYAQVFAPQAAPPSGAHRRRVPVVQSPLRQAIRRQRPAWRSSPNRATPCCSGATTTPWASMPGSRRPLMSGLSRTGVPAARPPWTRYLLWTVALNLPFAVCHPAGPIIAEPLLRSLAINLVLFVLPGLPLTGAMIGCGWLKRWSWMWVVSLSLAVFLGVLVAGHLLGLAVEGSPFWNATWIITNLAAGLNVLAGGEPAWGMRLRAAAAMAIGPLGVSFRGLRRLFLRRVLYRREPGRPRLQDSGHGPCPVDPAAAGEPSGGRSDELLLAPAADPLLRGRLVLVLRPVRASGRLRSRLSRGRQTG